ncbi:MAG: caspase family protein [Planctomycetota bacterium]
MSAGPGWSHFPRCGWLAANAMVIVILTLVSAAHGATHAVILSVPEYRSLPYPLPVARASANLMRRTLADRLRLPRGAIYTYRGAEVTRASVREILRDHLPRDLKQGDLLILYYAGHASLGYVSGAPVRLYFTYETTELGGRGEAGARWDPDTVIADPDLQEWLGPLHEIGVKTLFLRECCFDAEGYSAAIRDAAPVSGEAVSEVSVATYELSACSPGQGAYAMDASGESIGAFTWSFCKALAEV